MLIDRLNRMKNSPDSQIRKQCSMKKDARETDGQGPREFVSELYEDFGAAVESASGSLFCK